MPREVPQLEVGDGESDDGRLVQLGGDGRREREHFGQFVELIVLFAPAGSRRVPRLFLTQLEDAETEIRPFSMPRLQRRWTL